MPNHTGPATDPQELAMPEKDAPKPADQQDAPKPERPAEEGQDTPTTDDPDQMEE